jgi:plasmid stabilization system protein ParE
MRVVFDDEALDDLQRIFAEIAQDNPSAAGDLVGEFSIRRSA